MEFNDGVLFSQSNTSDTDLSGHKYSLMFKFLIFLNYHHSRSLHLLRHLKYSLVENGTATPHHEPFKRDSAIAEPALHNLSYFLLPLLSPPFSVFRGTSGISEEIKAEITLFHLYYLSGD